MVLMIDHRELGSTLRAWRERLSPETAGLNGDITRRTPGLRRQELAALSGVSAHYVTQLEQGRPVTPSTQVLKVLAVRLRLTEAETQHLFRLAQQSPPAPGQAPDRIPPGLETLLTHVGSPAAVFDCRWTIVRHNDAWTQLHGDRSDGANLVLDQFTAVPSRLIRTEQQTRQFEEAVVADLRASTSRYPRDIRLSALVERLTTMSEPFRRLWAARRVGSYDGESLIVDHPAAGRLRVDRDVVHTRDDDHRLVVCSIAPTERLRT
jgi:transcriptional regulator with XRE-family HTH domain